MLLPIAARLWLAAAVGALGATALVVPTPSTLTSHRARVWRFNAIRDNEDEPPTPEKVLDELLQEGKLRQASEWIKTGTTQDNKKLDLTKERWESIFEAIQIRTQEAEENDINLRQSSQELLEYPIMSQARMDMTYLYNALSEQNYLQLFGAVNSNPAQGHLPAEGSHTVTPTLLEQVTKLSMKALTPQPTNTVLLAGGLLAVLEGFASAYFQWDFNVLVFCTILSALLDNIFLNGAVLESVVRLVSPGVSQKICRHEAGHFLCAYLLGCPVEGYVTSAWGALQDARWNNRQVVSAGTSFFDPTLSQEFMQSKSVTRSSVDRYTIIVMAGIAAEGLMYGEADGGAGDEMALVAFLSQLNAKNQNQWNDVTIRNQARWGALQAVLLLQEYKPCFEALVETLERNGSLGDCIRAIEEAATQHNLTALQQPLGYIVDVGPYGGWTKEKPLELVSKAEGSLRMSQQEDALPPPPMDEEASLETLKEYRKQMEEKLRDIDERLKKL